MSHIPKRLSRKLGGLHGGWPRPISHKALISFDIERKITTCFDKFFRAVGIQVKNFISPVDVHQVEALVHHVPSRGGEFWV